MCGLGGIINKDGTTADSSLLEIMATVMHYREPDKQRKRLHIAKDHFGIKP